MINGHELIDWILDNGLHTKTTFKVIDHIEQMIFENEIRRNQTDIVKDLAKQGKIKIIRKDW